MLTINLRCIFTRTLDYPSILADIRNIISGIISIMDGTRQIPIRACDNNRSKIYPIHCSQFNCDPIVA